jgi:hypothetical protein
METMRRRSMIAGVVPCVRPLVVSSGPRDYPFYPLASLTC